MRVHQIVDYSYLYYKYYFQLKTGKMKKLTAPVDWKGLTVERDISQIYYSIREIEGFRRQLEKAGHDLTISICFDMPSTRGKDEEVDCGNEQETSIDSKNSYKGNRKKVLSQDDFDNMEMVMKLLKDAGYNTYRLLGYEADDIVNHLVRTEKDMYDYTVIYTPDSDLLVNVCDNVGVSRYKSNSGYSSVDTTNFSMYLEREFKVEKMPFNAIQLFKSTVGDKSDNVPGITKFGPKAFDKLVRYLDTTDVEWEMGWDSNYTKELLINSNKGGIINTDQLEQALSSLQLVQPMIISNEAIERPFKKTTREQRECSYSKLAMASLVD